VKRSVLILGLGLLLLLAAPLVVVFRDLGRLVTAEAIYLAWMVRLFVEGLPQLGLWVALLALILATALSNFARRLRSLSGDDGVRLAEAPGQVWALSRWIHRATLGDYARWTLHHHLEGLAWEVMAVRQGSTPWELKRRFRAGELAVDPEVAAFLESAGRRRFRPASGPRAWLRRLLRSEARDQTAIPPLERIVEFMEEQLAPGPGPHVSREQEIVHEHDTN